MHGLKAFSYDDLGGSTSNIYHEPAIRRGWKLVRYARENEPGFFLSGNHFDWKTQGRFGTRQYFSYVLRDTKGIGRHGANPVRVETGQALSEALQHRDGPFNGFFTDDVVVIETCREPD